MFARRLTTGFEKVIDPPNDSHEKGLAGLTEKMFGHPLDKRDQRSDWEKRPLTSQQLTYAALDAYVLIQLYEIIYDMAMKTDPGADAFNKLESYLRKNQNKPPKTAKKANLPVTSASHHV
jgi:ribonuclease D